LADIIMEAGKSEIFRVDCQTGHKGRANVAVEVQRLTAA